MGMAHWIDNADSYICPLCGYETNNPNRFHGKCPICGFMDVKDMRSADVVEVVRCKDCKHRYYNEDIEEYCCEQWADGYDTVCTDEEFCARGERKDNGKTD